MLPYVKKRLKCPGHRHQQEQRQEDTEQHHHS